MFDPAKFTLFLLASLLLILTPGPAVLYIVTRSISQGRLAGLASVAGVGLGNLTHAIFAALGLSAILATSATLFSVLKYAGALYLIVLGIRKFRSKPMTVETLSFQDERLRVVFWQGYAVGTLNPKTALFFLAFLPQFVARGAAYVAPWLQMLVMGCVFVVMAILSDGLYALLSGTLAPWLRRSSVLKHEKHVSGVVYCGLGVATAAGGK